MKPSTILDVVLEAGMGVFLLALLFAPFQIFARYAFTVLSVMLILIAASLVHELFVFAKGSQRRRESMEPPAPGRRILRIRIKTIVSWLGIVAVFVLLWNFQQGKLGSKACPDFVSGGGSVAVDVFYSPFCPACWTVENEAEKLKDVKLVNYDVRYCSRYAELGLHGAPSFAIIQNNTVTQKGHGVQEFIEAVKIWR